MGSREYAREQPENMPENMITAAMELTGANKDKANNQVYALVGA